MFMARLFIWWLYMFVGSADGNTKKSTSFACKIQRLGISWPREKHWLTTAVTRYDVYLEATHAHTYVNDEDPDTWQSYPDVNSISVCARLIRSKKYYYHHVIWLGVGRNASIVCRWWISILIRLSCIGLSWKYTTSNRDFRTLGKGPRGWPKTIHIYIYIHL
jgi:hypothetical protein